MRFQSRNRSLRLEGVGSLGDLGGGRERRGRQRRIKAAQESCGQYFTLLVVHSATGIDEGWQGGRLGAVMDRSSDG